MFNKLREKLQNLLGKPDKKEIEKKKQEKPQTKKSVPKTKKEKKIFQPKEEKIASKKEQILEPEQEVEKEDSEESYPKKSFFSQFTKSLTSRTIKKEQLEEIFEPIELILLENNVALEVVDKIRERLEQDLVNVEIKKSEDLQVLVKNSLKESISNVLIEPPNLLEQIKFKKTGPYTIIFFGINGSGKTTSLAKLANYLKKNKISCILGAGDTFRAASIEQLEKHAEKLNLKVIKHEYGADPTAVAFDTQAFAQKNKIQCVLIDTAGRMYTKSNLIREMEKIIRVTKPDLKIFVGESITGNDAVEQARTFNEAIGIDGIILTKVDVDEKGGTALSVSEVTGKPIYFLGTGQSYDNFEPFKKQKILENLGLD